MNRTSTSRYTRVALMVVLMLTLAIALTGCNKKSADSPIAGTTAKGNATVARSALSTTAPDAKLLLVQTANVISTTSTPVWQYLFGSPKDGSIYAVTVKDKKVMGTQPYGDSGMDKAEWALVPADDEWAIDSDAAYKSALAANKKNTAAIPYAMGFVTYIPKSAAASSSIEPFVWSIAFDPQSTLGSPNTVNVDAKTGKATLAK